MKTKLMNFRIPEHLKVNLDHLTTMKGVTKTSIMIRLLESYVRDELIQTKNEVTHAHRIQSGNTWDNQPRLKNQSTPRWEESYVDGLDRWQS